MIYHKKDNLAINPEKKGIISDSPKINLKIKKNNSAKGILTDGGITSRLESLG